MRPGRRTVFFVSDRTGITVEIMGRSLLTQFPWLEKREKTLPFVDSPEKARNAAREISRVAEEDGARPLVFHTFVDPDARDVLLSANAFFLDCFQTLLNPLEREIGGSASLVPGLSHGQTPDYHRRIEAVNYALKHDDGVGGDAQAEVVLVGVSRSGKTPTCLYLALQYGIFAANYPLTPEDFAAGTLPSKLRQIRKKLFGLDIDPERLSRIRTERQPGTHYADSQNCAREVAAARELMLAAGIPSIDTTNLSIEEVAATIRHRLQL